MNDVRFEFGKNWSDFSETIGSDALNAAIAGLERLLPEDFDPHGKSLLDIGSGSGLHAVAAHKIGFSPITATDYDPNSVETTRRNASKFGATVNAFQDDVLDSKIEGQFDVVYSWGVLHHTGDMEKAIEKAAGFVAPGGLLIISIYTKTALCGMWAREKAFYSSSPAAIQAILRAVYMSAYVSYSAIRGKHPIRFIRSYGKQRGMKWSNDVHDWMGGYPYQSASSEDITSMLGSFGLSEVMAFPLKPGIGVWGTGCSEYVFRRGG